VARLVQALSYSPEGRGIDPLRGHLILPVDSVSDRKLVLGMSPGGKCGHLHALIVYIFW
jgi:hypothetical protein